MNELQIFENEEFGAVEVLYLEGEPLFNPRDIGKCLDMEEKTVRNHLGKMDSDEVVLLRNSNALLKGFRKIHNTGENFLTECGVYSLILKSRKPSAVKFQKWVTKEVLPSIRKNEGKLDE